MGILWTDPNVLVASIHADPDIEYPYTSGFADQVRPLTHARVGQTSSPLLSLR